MDKEKKKDKEASKARAKEEKRRKQEAKAVRKENKSNKKKLAKGGGGDDRDDDGMDDEQFEKLVASLAVREAAATAVTVEKLERPPPPRASFSLCLAGSNPQDGFVVFGGEFFDGATSKCFDETFRCRAVTTATSGTVVEWKRVSSPTCPPPRCAHASCVTPTHVYILGGEFSTAWRFHHYNDFWRFDLKTNQWSILPSLNGPSPRSGARMLAWKNFIIVFGGFYEASRGVRWHDDLHFFDIRTEKWSRAKFASNMQQQQQPSARSGFQFVAHPSKPLVFLYGGYSKIAASSSAQKGRSLDDMWILHLTPPTQKQAFPECRWEFVPRKGQAPSKRSGASFCMHKNRMLSFGGVSDHETQNDLVGDFHNSLFAFDLDRLRWFELGLKTSSASARGGGAGRRGGGGSKKDNTSSVGGGATEDSATIRDDEDDDLDEGGGDDNEDEDDSDHGQGLGLKEDGFYVIMNGRFVLVEQDEEDEEEAASENALAAAATTTTTTSIITTPVSTAAILSEPPATAVLPNPTTTTTTTSNNRPESAVVKAVIPWNGKPSPAPRISSGLCVMNNRLFVVGGTTEVGDEQKTFDDMWMLDLNKMDGWVEIDKGTWHEQKWAGAEGDEDEDDDDEDDDDEDEDEEEDEEEEEAADDDDVNDQGEVGESSTKQKKKKTKKTTQKATAQGGNGEGEDEDDDEDEDEANIRLLSAEVKELRDELGVEDFNTPSPSETLGAFFKRTVQHWLDECAKRRRDDERLSGKELRRLAFALARERFDTLYPLLEKLNALQEAQRLAEEEAAEFAAKVAKKAATAKKDAARKKKTG